MEKLVEFVKELVKRGVIVSVVGIRNDELFHIWELYTCCPLKYLSQHRWFSFFQTIYKEITDCK